MEERFFKTEFQFEKYLNARLLEVSDEGERRALKELMRETLIPFYEHTEEAYAELEKRLTQTTESQSGRFEIITGVERRSQVDITEEAMVPMRYEDLSEFLVDISEMKECLSRGEVYTVMRVFLALDYGAIRRIARERRNFHGAIRTADGEYSAVFTLKKDESYMKQITNLYEVFENNGQEWNTVCAPYLGKYFEVQVTKTDCPLEEEVVGITVNFEEYQDKVIYDLIPMWNVRVFEERTGAYPDFALDRIHYEHCIYGSRFKDGRDYLVDADHIKLWNIFWQDGDMHIICDEDQPVRWKLIELGSDAWNKRYDMPVFGNYHRPKMGERCIHTLAEVKRYVAKLGYESYLYLLEVRQEEVRPGIRGTYSMDAFLEDEIRVGENRPGLIFRFRPADKENYLNQDIMSYLMSKIQWQMPEFECIGELE